MPGKRITDLQMNKYKELRGTHSQEASAVKAGISVASARRVETAATGCRRNDRHATGEPAKTRWPGSGRRKWCQCSKGHRR